MVIFIHCHCADLNNNGTTFLSKNREMRIKKEPPLRTKNTNSVMFLSQLSKK